MGVGGRHTCSRQREGLEARENMVYLTNTRTVRKLGVRTMGNISDGPQMASDELRLDK